MLNLLDVTCASLAEYLVTLNEKPFRAQQLIQWIHQQGISDFNCMTNLSKQLRSYLQEHAVLELPVVRKHLVSRDGTQKWLLALADGALIETVFIPEAGRGTLCISTQVGCPLKCTFCATGHQGFQRNLRLSEIIGQVMVALKKLSPDGTNKQHIITNVVFMGMGEPLLNLIPVTQTLELLFDTCAYGLSKYRVTISTAGLVPELLQLRKLSEVSLAVSLHAPHDELRSQLMPINNKYPLRELMAVLQQYFTDQRRYVTIEYLLLAGINDSVTHAKQLVKLLAPLKCKVNLIAFNGVTAVPYQAPEQGTIDAFRNILLAAGMNTITRKSRGADIAAACGQLKGNL